MKFNIFRKRKDKVNNESKDLQTTGKDKQQYEHPINLFRDWESKLLEKSIKEELWEGWEDFEKAGYKFRRDDLYHEITIKEIPIYENKVNRKKIRKKIYAYLIKKIKENNFKISPSYYIKDITHREYEKIVNKSIKELKEKIDKNLFKDEFNYEISTKKEKKYLTELRQLR